MIDANDNDGAVQAHSRRRQPDRRDVQPVGRHVHDQ
ncbi:hypothetical protein DP42_5267 [Burkholderia pseudomallei]|nr:hypothetical protein DP42_5267 [Burkholderia pseudomallei]KOT10955.1 hypothetical protein DM77_2849 [Burkholderia mallei]